MYVQQELFTKNEDELMAGKIGKIGNQITGLFKRIDDLKKDLNKVASEMNQIMEYKDARMR